MSTQLASLTNNRQRAAARELLRRVEARRDFRSFCRYMCASHHPDAAHANELAPHQELLVDALQQLADEESSKLACSMPPGSAKSQIASVLFPCWLLARDPRTMVICVAATESLSEAFSRRRRALMLTPEWSAVAQSELDPAQRSLAQQGSTSGGFIKSCGMGSSIVGSRSDFNLLDDPITSIEVAFSLPQLDAQVRWFDAELRSRLKPGGRECIVMTRWAEQDLVGVMMERHEAMQESWKFIRLPMECDEPESDALHRQMGALLWPGHYTASQIQEAKLNPLLWAGLYQQRPVTSGGEWCDASLINVVDRVPAGQPSGVVLSLDLAIGVTSSADYTVILVCEITPSRDIYVTECFRRRVTPDVSARAVVEMCQRHAPGMLLCDHDNATRVWSVLLEDIAKKHDCPIPMRALRHMNKDKQSRAASLRGHIHEGKLHLVRAPWNTALIEELSKFPGGRNDDLVDALANVSREIANIAPIEQPKRAPEALGAIVLGPRHIDNRQPERTGEPIMIGADSDALAHRYAFERERI